MNCPPQPTIIISCSPEERPPLTAAEINQRIIAIRAAAFRVAISRGLSRDDADDVAQEVAIRAWHLLSKGGVINSANAWANRATRNHIIDAHRRRTSQKAGGDLVESLDDKDGSGETDQS